MANRIVKVGIIGCGGIANGKHMPSLKQLPGVELVAFCDIITERAEAAKATYGTPDAKVYTDYKELLADESIEVVHVCTPNRSHSFITVDALDAGKHVVTANKWLMCEYYKELIDLANENGVVLAIETGPETPETLRDFIVDTGTAGVGVNLDPANFAMVTDVKAPDAVRVLGKYIVHTHAKDGIMLKKTEPRIIYDFFAYGGIEDLRLGEYFKEVPLGQGAVLWDEYLCELNNIGYKGFLTIERECGEDPEADIRLAVDFLKRKIC